MKIAIFDRKKGIIALLSISLITTLFTRADSLCPYFPISMDQAQYQEECARPFDKKEFKKTVYDYFEAAWKQLQDEQSSASNLLLINAPEKIMRMALSDIQFQTTLSIFRERFKAHKRTLSEKNGVRIAEDDQTLTKKFAVKYNRIFLDFFAEVGIEEGIKISSTKMGKFFQIASTLLPSFLLGRNVRGKSLVPAWNEILSLDTLGDIAIGYGSLASIAIARELTAGVVCRLKGQKPQIVLGGSPCKKADRSKNSNLSVTGIMPCGVTLVDNKIFDRKSSIASRAAGSAAALITYLAIRGLSGTLHDTNDLKNWGSGFVIASTLLDPIGRAFMKLGLKIQEAALIQ